MLFNCLTCGKTISSKKDICPYCAIDISHIAPTITEKKHRENLIERYKGTLFSLVFKG